MLGYLPVDGAAGDRCPGGGGDRCLSGHNEITNLFGGFEGTLEEVNRRWGTIFPDTFTLVSDPENGMNQVVQLTADSIAAGKNKAYLGSSCIHKAPVDKRQIWLEFYMMRRSAGYEHGQINTEDAPPEILVFELSRPGEETLALRFEQHHDSNFNWGIFELYHNDTSIDVFVDPTAIAVPPSIPSDPSTGKPKFHPLDFVSSRFDMDVWHRFQVYYENKTGKLTIVKDGIPLYPVLRNKSAEEQRLKGKVPKVKDPSLNIGGILDYDFIFSVGAVALGPGERQYVLVDNVRTSLTRACRGEAPPETVTDHTFKKGVRLPFRVEVGSSVEASSGYLDLQISPPSVRFMNRSFAPQFGYYSGNVEASTTIGSITTHKYSPGTSPNSISWQMTTKDTELQYSFTPVEGKARQAYLWKDSGEEAGSRGAMMMAGASEEANTSAVYYSGSMSQAAVFPYGMLVSNDFNFDDLRMITPVAGENLHVNLNEAPFGSGWFLEGFEDLKTRADNRSRIVTVNSRGNADVYYSAGYENKALTDELSGHEAQMSEPAHAIAGANGEIFVSDPAGGKVMKFQPPAGMSPYAETAPSVAFSSAGGVSDSHDLGVSGTRLFAVSASEDTLYERSDGGFRKVWDKMLAGPYGVAAAADGKVYVSNHDSDMIVKIDLAEQTVEGFVFDIRKPRAIEFGPDGYLYALHQNLNDEAVLSRISPEGIMNTHAYLGKGTFDALAVMPEGDILVTESTRTDEDGKRFGKPRVWRVNGNGMKTLFVREGLEEPTGVAVADGAVYVVEKSGRIHAYFPDVEYLPLPGNWSKIIRNSDDTFTKRFKNGGKYLFDPNGRMTATEDRNANRFSFEYSTDGLLTRIAQPVGGVWNFSYSGGKLTTVTDPGGRSMSFSIDASNNLTNVGFPNGSTMAFLYDDSHHLTAKTDRRGYTTTYSYDESGRIASVQGARPVEQHEFAPSQTQELLNGEPEGSLESPRPHKAVPKDGYRNPRGSAVSFDTNAAGQLQNSTGPQGEQHVYERDEDGNVVYHRNPLNEVTETEYDSTGNMVWRKNLNLDAEVRYEYEQVFNNAVKYTDANGNLYQYAYDAHGNLIETRMPESVTTRTEYNERGQAVRMVGGRGYSTYFEYDALGNTWRVSGPENSSTSFGCDEFGNVVAVTDARGNSTTYQYDVMNNKTRETSPNGLHSDYARDGGGLVTSVTDSKGRMWTYEYDEAGLQLREIDPEGKVTESAHDPNRNPERTVSMAGTDFAQSVESGYDESDNVTDIEAGPGEDKLEHDALGRVTRSEDPEGAVTRKEYDAAGRAVRVSVEGAGVAQYVYDKNGNATAVIDSEGRRWLSFYDGLNRLVRAESPDVGDGRTAVSRMEYDPEGNIVRAADPEGRTYTFAYDKANRLVRWRDPLGNGADYDYDKAGNVTAVTDANGKRTEVSYDNMNRAVETTRPDEMKVRVERNDAGWVTAVVDPTGKRMEFTYDMMGRVTGRSHPSAGTETFDYDAAGRLTSFTRPDGSRIELGYDEFNRLTGKKLPGDESFSRVFAYNRRGDLTSGSAPGGASAFAYDAAGRFTGETSGGAGAPGGQPPFGYAYELAPDGYVTGTSFGPNARVGFTYDGALRMTGAELPGVFGAEWEYDLSGLTTKKRTGAAGGGTETRVERDAAGRMTSMDCGAAEGGNDRPVMDRDYEYDDAGNITAMTDAGGRHEYVYDDLYRLAEADHPEESEARLPDEEYEYDAAGNRLFSVGARVMLGALNRAEYTYNPDTMRLEEDSVYTFSYDGRGNIIRKARKDDGLTWDYSYDAEDKMLTARRYQGAAGAADADGNVTWTLADAPDVAATYTYDFIGRRTSKEVNGRVVRYAYAGLNLAAEFEYNENQPSTAYYYAPGALDHPLAMTRAMTSGDPEAGETFYYHYDERGSVAALTNEAGETVQRYEYDAFGNMTLVEGDVANPFTFTAREWDAETGLYYFRARYYDPETGRFLQTDPIYALGLYAYAENNPVMFTDPLGLSSIGMSMTGPRSHVSSYTDEKGILYEDFVCACKRLGECSGDCHNCHVAFAKFLSKHPLRDGWVCPDHMCRCDMKKCLKPSEVNQCRDLAVCATCHKYPEILGLKDPPERDACEYYYGLKCDQFPSDPCLYDFGFACFGMPAPGTGGEGPGQKPDDSKPKPPRANPVYIPDPGVPMERSACMYYHDLCQMGDQYACKAYSCCRDFASSRQNDLVRGCLINYDNTKCSKIPDNQRSTCRLAAHIVCYGTYFKPPPVVTLIGSDACMTTIMEGMD